jgi:hypothetical protein
VCTLWQLSLVVFLLPVKPEVLRLEPDLKPNSWTYNSLRFLGIILRVAMADFWHTYHHDGKISPSWWGCGRKPMHPLSLYLLSCSMLQCTLQLRGKIHSPYFISTPICTLWFSDLSFPYVYTMFATPLTKEVAQPNWRKRTKRMLFWLGWESNCVECATITCESTNARHNFIGSTKTTYPVSLFDFLWLSLNFWFFLAISRPRFRVRLEFATIPTRRYNIPKISCIIDF